MAPLNRRRFLQSAALASGAAHTSLPEEKRSHARLWIDPKAAALPARPWRKIHLDFHNSQHIAKIGEHFQAEEFGDRLVAANVDSIVVFAKDMHGYFYYPSQYGPVHPGLSFDLLGAQVKACRDRKITVYAYYCTTWDNYLAEHHPEWLVVKRDRTTTLPKFDSTPGWTALCIANDGFVELMRDHVTEFVSRYPVDGAWFDMPAPYLEECFCSECLKQLKARGLDPISREAQCNHKQALEKAFLEKMQSAVTSARPGCQVDFNSQNSYGLRDRVRFMDNIDIEALPSVSHWGYYFFPLAVRYARTHGVTTYGMTGRFKAAWADFGGLKLPAQLETEVAGIVAHGARCDIGDQMPPSGRLDPAVYHVVGKAYDRIKALEPWLNGAVPVTEAALLVAGLPLNSLSSDAHLGLTKLLSECRIQFDVLEQDAEWERYGLVVLPDNRPVSEAASARLQKFVADGGAVIACHHGGLIAGGDASCFENHGISYAGPSPFDPAYLVPKEKFTGDLPVFEYALYGGASQWRVRPPARTVAYLGQPSFQRSPKHYTSHAQSPFDRLTEYAAVAVSGRVAVFGFPLGSAYFGQGYWVYRQALQHVLKAVHPVPLLTSNAPLSAELTVTHQSARHTGAKPRYLVHIVNWSPNRSTPKHPIFYEDPIPLTEVVVRLNVPEPIGKACLAGAKTRLAVKQTSSGVEVIIPRVAVHEVICFDVA
jgi:hypothetical protein